MPVIRVPSMGAHISGRKTRNDTHSTHSQSRIPAPVSQSTYKSHDQNSVYDPHTQSRPPKAKFTSNSLGLNTLYTISKNRSTTKKAKSTKCPLNITAQPTSYTRVNPYPNPHERAHPDPRFKVPAMPALPFKVSKHTAHAHAAQVKPSQLRAPQQNQNRCQDGTDDELEASFASNMSLNSPPRTTIPLSEEDLLEYVPMDISPAPQRALQVATGHDKHAKPRGLSRTASQRSFGRDVSNVEKAKINEGKTSGGKKLARSALPMEWMNTAKAAVPRENNDELSPPTPKGRRENLFARAMDIPSSDAMDIDESFSSATASAPTPACPLSTGTAQFTPFPSTVSPPAPSTLECDSEPELELDKGAPLAGLFKNISPARRGARRSLHEDSSMSMSRDSPLQPVHKKRRSFSPEADIRRRQLSLLEQDSLSSSPGLMSSPSVSKLERLQAKPLRALPIEPVLNANNKRPRRLALSAMIPPADLVVEESLKTARPVMQGGAQKKEEEDAKGRRFAPPPIRRAFSAAYPANMNVVDQSQDTDPSLSMDSDAADVSSPALAYAKRQQVKTIRRCDGTDDFRSMTGATAMLRRDNEVRIGRKSDEGQPLERNTPRSKYLNAGGPGLGSFGDNEAHGKILPCHRVKEDGLMRIGWDTVNKLLDGHYDTRIGDFHIIDCRFDYEYNGGHIPGAININTTAGVEEFLLGTNVKKPRPSTSGDHNKKTILVFHCEFSIQRAPTFAKHLRSRDRAMNNHVYPNIHYPEVYILEGGYCEYYKQCGVRCEPRAYVKMDDPYYAEHRAQDLDQFRKGKFGRTKSYAYGEGKNNLLAALQQPKRNSAPSGPSALFAAGNIARSRRTNGLLQTLQEDTSGLQTDDEDDTDLGDSPCPAPSKGTGVAFMGRRMPRAPLTRAETYGPSRLTLGY